MGIVIIGGGSSGLFVLKNLLEHFQKDSSLAHAIQTITLITNGRPGEGNPHAFGPLPDFLLLNTANHWIDPFLPEWQKYRRRASVSEANDAMYSSRKEFGDFLKSEYLRVRLALEHYILFTEISGQAKSVKVEDSNLIVEGDNFVIKTDRVFYCLGAALTKTLPNNNSDMDGVLDPFNHTHMSQISGSSRVGILGTRLTAIDVLKFLHSKNHKGPIIAVSRTGRLPRIQSIDGMYEDPCIAYSGSQSQLDQLKPASINILKELFLKELSKVDCSQKTLKSLLDRSPSTPQRWSEELMRSHQSSAMGLKHAFALTGLMESAWMKLSDREKNIFIKRYRSTWLSNLVGIPTENGQVIQKLFENKVLQVRGDLKSVERLKRTDSSGGSFRLNFQDGSTQEVDYLIDATAHGFFESILNPLMNNLHAQNMCKITPSGALKVNWETMEALSPKSALSGKMFVVGEMAIGPNFVTNSIEGNFMMANKAVTHLVSVLKKSITQPLVPSLKLASRKIQMRLVCK